MFGVIASGNIDIFKRSQSRGRQTGTN